MTTDAVPPTPPELRVRRGEPGDAAALAELMFRVPGREAVAMAGSAAAAQRFQAILFDRTLRAGSSTTLVAEGEVGLAGFAELTTGEETASFATVARAALGAMGVVGALRAATRWSARRNVDLELPDGGVHLVELHVEPERRGLGIGGFLLARVDEEAVALGAEHVSLTTAIDNPARRLYERNAYRLVDERRDPRYERITGSPGRVLMVKALRPG